MCRIAGIIDLSNPLSVPLIHAMCNSMRHGGPDDGGTYLDPDRPLALGVRRLAILDLSPAGHQPMCSANGELVLAFNGEIYNYKALRRELAALGHRFLSQTDTEVVLAAYKQWGTGCFNRFNGMFGLCIWNRTTRQLVLARDHAGMKPLYYFFDKHHHQLYFASEVRAFKTLRPNWPDDENWRIHLLAYGHMPEPHTTLQGVQSLPAGHLLVLQLPEFSATVSAWYQPEPRPLITHAAEAELKLYQTLQHAVRRHLVADAPLGVFLSGGTDSSILTILAAKLLPQPPQTVSLVFDEPGFSERRFQDLVAQQTGARHRACMVSAQMFQQHLPDVLAAMDQPSNDGINAYFISRFARAAGFKAVLSGLGADELFGGYHTFGWGKRTQRLQKLPSWALAMAWMAPNDRLKRIAFLKNKGVQAENLFYRGFFTPKHIATLLDASERHVLRVLFGKNEHTDPHTHQPDALHISHIEQRFYMRNQLLRDADAMSMWHGLEIRMPFLDREVVEYADSVAPRIRFAAAGKKQFLINAFRNELPEAIWQRKKMGFSMPFHLWVGNATVAGAADHRLFALEKQFKSGKLKWSRYWTYLLSTGQHISFLPTAKRVLFLSLKSFSATGGIEKFNRCFSLALQQLAVGHQWQVSHLSVYDQHTNPQYFKGCAKRKLLFAAQLLRHVHRYDVVVAGHVNLIKLLALARTLSKAQFCMVAHGVEVWQPLGVLQQSVLKSLSRIFSVSAFTKGKLIDVHGVSASRISVFPNTLDPFFATAVPASGANWRQSLGIAAQARVLLTVARLSVSEKYKGYDDVLSALPLVARAVGPVVYVLAGKADEEEAARINLLAESLGVRHLLMLTDFVPDQDLPSLYQMADLFVMPSRKEGFGIVFIEAASCGLPLIAGNQDGSVDALLQGQLGRLVTPGNIAEIADAVVAALAENRAPHQRAAAQALVAQQFGFEAFTERLGQLLAPENLAKCAAAT
jgi:asparagine synthase (glutamine-hydrolysing)